MRRIMCPWRQYKENAAISRLKALNVGTMPVVGKSSKLFSKPLLLYFR